MAFTPDLDNPEFQDIWKLVSYTRQSVFMTGKAGTGKSTFLRYIVENTKKKTVVLAPTGIAAVNAGGVTLHSFFHIPLKPLLPDDPELLPRNLRNRLKLTAQQVKLIRELELIIIDEVSMVRADIIDFIDKILRVYTGHFREPFGGKQMLFVGDVFQLEPVVTADVRNIFRDLYASPYFFSARVFREFALVSIELRKVYRQTDTEFISILDRMRAGTVSQADLQAINGRVLPPAKMENKSDDFTVTLAPKRDTVEAINSSRLKSLRRKLHTYRGIVRDTFPENALPAPLELDLKVGAQIVFVRNDPDKRWVNGTVGKVHSLSESFIEIELEDGNIESVKPEIWENVRYSYNKETKKIDEDVLGSFTQFPVRLAWALTIHKSQGLTFSKVIIDMQGGAFAAGQAYVALSRCQSMEGLTLRAPLNAYDFFINPAIRNFSGMFNNPSVFNAALTAAKADDCFHQAAINFDSGNFSASVDNFIEGLYARDILRDKGAMRLIKQKLYRLGAASQTIANLTSRLEEDRKKFRELANEYVSLGLDCLSDENFGAAIANFDKALRIAPDHRKAMLLKGEATLDGGDLLSAAETFGRILKEDPKNFDALMALAKIHASLGTDEDRYTALNYLLAAEEVSPESAPLHDRLADLYAAMKDEEESDRHRALARRLRRRKK